MKALQRSTGPGLTTLSVYVSGREKLAGATLALVRKRHLQLVVAWQPDGSLKRGTLRDVLRGRYDRALTTLAGQLAGLKPPAIVRPMPEPNTPWYAWSGATPGNGAARYVKAFRHVRAVLHAGRGGRRIRLLWTPYARSVPEVATNEIRDYFPGRSQVDLVGAVGYNFGATGELDWALPQTLFQVAYDTIDQLARKPFWIAETGSTSVGGDKVDWIAELQPLAATMPRLAGVIWYDVSEDAGDFRIRESAATLGGFRSYLRAVACR